MVVMDDKTTTPAPLQLLTQKEVAQILHTPERTLEGRRYRGGGPAYVKFGRKVLYKADSVQRFVDKHEQGVDA